MTLTNNKNVREVQYCKKCLMPDSRPRIHFDSEGICNACHHAAMKKNIDWANRKIEFTDLLQQHRSNNKWDCIVPWSGGKDSSSIAYKLKFEYGLNPLLVTFSPMMPNDVGNHNREALINIGFDHIYFRPNQYVHRKLATRFFIERGNPKVAWEAGVNSVPIQLAVDFNIPLVVFAEHGESEYGGKVLNEESLKIRDFTEVVEHQIGDDPRNWENGEISYKDLSPYIYPDFSEIKRVGVKAIYFSYFHKWSMFENYNYVKAKYDFRTQHKGRTCGTFTNFDSLDDKIDDLYYYMQFIKFGFGRCIRDASRLIQNDHLTREKGLEYALKYDGEFPTEYLDEVLQYLDLTENELHEIINKHRNQEIWEMTDGKWELRYPLSQIFNEVEIENVNM